MERMTENANKQITIYCFGDELYPDDKGRYSLSDEEQEALDDTILCFDNKEYTRTERTALYDYRETSGQFGDLEFIISQKIAF